MDTMMLGLEESVGWVSETVGVDSRLAEGAPIPGVPSFGRGISSPGVLQLVGAYVYTCKERQLEPCTGSSCLETGPVGQTPLARVSVRAGA